MIQFYAVSNMHIFPLQYFFYTNDKNILDRKSIPWQQLIDEDCGSHMIIKLNKQDVSLFINTF